MIKTLGITRELVTGKHPTVLLHARGKLGNLPILGESALALHPQVSDFAVSAPLMCFVNNPRFVSGNFAAAGSRSRFPGPRREKDVQHFSGADAIQNFDPEALAKS